MQYHKPIELAKVLGYSKQAIYLAIKQKQIKVKKIPSRLVFAIPDDEFQRLIKKQEELIKNGSEMGGKYWLFKCPRTSYIDKEA